MSPIYDASTTPFLVGRFDCPPGRIEEIDGWIPKHLDDSLAHDAIFLTTYYHVVTGLPSVLGGPGNRSVFYFARDLPGMLAWMDSPELTGAVEDSADRETTFYPLDGESPGTANIYHAASATAFRELNVDAAGQHLLVERLEIAAGDEAEFDNWLEREHLPALSESALIDCAVRLEAYRDAPDRFPFDRYRSIGNRAVVAGLVPEVDPHSVLDDTAIKEALTDSRRWDFKVPYVRREVFRCVLVREEPS
jgi:hypothetical protein